MVTRFNLSVKFKFILFSLFLVVLAIAFVSPVLHAQETSVAQTEEQDDFLSKEQAFKISAKKLEANKAILSFDIAPGYMLYLEHFKFQDLQGSPIDTKTLAMPVAKNKIDEVLGNFKIYTHHIDIPLSLSSSASSASSPSGFKVQYQGCAESGFCYPPMSKQIVFDNTGKAIITDLEPYDFETTKAPTKTSTITGTTATTTTSNTTTDTSTKASAAAALDSNASDTDSIANLIEGRALPLTLLAFLGIGIMLAFTPCVLPMVPILANILVGQSDAPLSKKRCLYLAGLYVLSVSVCYAVAGMAAGLLGSHLQTTLQQPIFLIALSFLLLLFALNQLNLVQVQFPSIFGDALHQLEQKQKQGSAVGAIAMGAISALMVSPCVTPALVGALTYIGQTGNALLGGAALFALAFGMGLPLLIVASIGSHLLPKAGAWMKYIKYATGLLLLVLAGSILLRAIPQGVDMAACAHGPFIAVHDKKELTQLLATARQQNKPVILDVYADWCISCKQMDKEIFENKDVQKKLSNIQLLRLDLTQQTKESQALQKELGIIGPPMVLFFDMEGKEVKSYRIAGKSETDHFLSRVNNFLKQSNSTPSNKNK